jgi:(2R)-3-sulfolactate dehydrogenase (NADP+)
MPTLSLADLESLARSALTGAAMGFEASSLFVDEGNRPRIWQAFVVVDPESLAGRDTYLERVELLITEMTKDAGVRLPGYRRDALAVRATKQGVEISQALADELRRRASAR